MCEKEKNESNPWEDVSDEKDKGTIYSGETFDLFTTWSRPIDDEDDVIWAAVLSM